ncbi:putative quinol monooxygenase [Niveispirillum cyanobacteriorum]|uniref:putative quinol monooxygenase n=1 Tax=Niveispirillum cyanobacteriorum TaxID=1612173 RepID=UPI0018F81758|nr:antibiotic biosynthesis monooxygenase family protein [Niveispirillum cyanobacteriorum]
MYGFDRSHDRGARKRDELASILLEGTGAMPGCLSYIVAADPTNPDALWITEAWDSKDSPRGKPETSVGSGGHCQGPSPDCRV